MYKFYFSINGKLKCIKLEHDDVEKVICYMVNNYSKFDWIIGINENGFHIVIGDFDDLGKVKKKEIEDFEKKFFEDLNKKLGMYRKKRNNKEK